MNKKIIFMVLTSSFAVNNCFADTKSNLLSQMSGNVTPTTTPQGSNGGIVNNNVNYNANIVSNNQSSSSNNQSNDVQNTAYQNNNNNNQQVQKPKPKKKVYKSYKKPINYNKLSDQTFDIAFNGDISLLINKLKDYDPQLKVLPSLGKKANYNIAFDLQGVGIEDIISNVSAQTSDGVKVIYSSENDTIRLSYITKISYAANAAKESMAWRNGDNKPKPILTPDGIILFPYSQYAAKIACKTQQVCDLRFDKGEHIIDAVMGDNQKWAVQGIVSGAGSNQVQHIILKPFYSGLETNMIVTSDKGRVYNITLTSSETNYISSAGWYYPQDIQNEIEAKFKKLQADAAGFNSNNSSAPNGNTSSLNANVNSGNLSSPNGTVVNTNGLDDDGLPLLNMDFRYKTSGDDVIWKPIMIFNDGIRTYIKTDPKALFQQAPTFVILDENTNSFEIVNYRQKGNYFIVDQVFKKGALIYNVGSNQQKVEITHITDTSKKNINNLY